MFKCLLHHVFAQRDAMWPSEPRAARRLSQLLVAASQALSESANPHPNPNPHPHPHPNPNPNSNPSPNPNPDQVRRAGGCGGGPLPGGR